MFESSENLTETANPTLELQGEDAEAVAREQELPATDTPARRATFDRVDRLARRLGSS